MSTWLYCNNPEPHEMHEWSIEVYSGVGTMRTTLDWHHCAGIRATDHLAECLDHLRIARDTVTRCEDRARYAAKSARIPIWQAMNEDRPDDNRLHLEQPA